MSWGGSGEFGEVTGGYEGAGQSGVDLPSGYDPSGRGKTGVSSIGYEKVEDRYETTGKFLGMLFGFLSPVPGGALIGRALGKLAGRSMARSSLSRAISENTGLPQNQVETALDAAVAAGILDARGSGGEQEIAVNRRFIDNQYGNWWEQHAGPVTTGMGPGKRLSSGGTWVPTPDGQYFLTPEMLSPYYEGPISWEGGRTTLPSDPDDPRNSAHVEQGGRDPGETPVTTTDPATGVTYPANQLSSSRMKDPKKDPWGNFLDVYFGIKPEGDDPGVPSYLDRVLRDVTFKQDEAKEFLDKITKTSGETLASLQPYSDILKQKVEGTKPISLGFGGKPVTSFISRPDRETGDRYKDLTAAIAEVKNQPASTRYALADLLSPEKGYMTYKTDYQDLMKLLLDKYRTERGLDIEKQRADQSEPGFSWTAFAKDIIGIGGEGYDVYKKLFPTSGTTTGFHWSDLLP